jgi:hypothetical protein
MLKFPEKAVGAAELLAAVALYEASAPVKRRAWPSKSPVPVTTGAVVLVELVELAGLVVLVAAWRSLVAAGKTGFSIWK